MATSLSNMDLEELALWSSLYGSQMMRESNREANITNVNLAREASAFSAHEASKNRDWQEKMSGTAHQREMADLMAAGLNPILTATGGSGAGIGSGATGQAQLGRVSSELPSNPLSELSSSVYDARRMRDIDKKQLEANLQQTESNVKLNNQNIATQQTNILKTLEEIATQKTQQNVNSALTAKSYADAAASGKYAELLASQTAGVNYDNTKKGVQTKMYEVPEGQAGMSILDYIKSWLPWTR